MPTAARRTISDDSPKEHKLNMHMRHVGLVIGTCHKYKISVPRTKFAERLMNSATFVSTYSSSAFRRRLYERKMIKSSTIMTKVAIENVYTSLAYVFTGVFNS